MDESRSFRIAAWAVCALAAALPSDYVVAALLADGSSEGFRSPSVYIGAIALAVSAPIAPRMLRQGRALLPVLLMFAATAVSVIIVVAQSVVDGLATLDDLGLDRPFKLAGVGILFAWVASHPKWRRPLVTSYLVGWSVFVFVAGHMVLTGRMELVQHYDVTRATVMNLNLNEQSVVASTGMVVLLASALAAGRRLVALAAGIAFVAGGLVFIVGSSRTALAALTLGCIYVIVAALRQGLQSPRNLARTGAALLVIAVALVWVTKRSSYFADATEAMSRRVGAALEGEDLGSRDTLALSTIDLAFRNPAGLGYGGTARHLGLDPHNGYLKVIAEGGVVALVLLTSVLLWMGRSVIMLSHDRTVFGAAGALVLLSVAAAGGQAMVHFSYWYFFGFIAGSSTPSRSGPDVPSLAG